MTERMLNLKNNFFLGNLGVGTKTILALSLFFWLPVAILSAILFYLFQEIVTDKELSSIRVHLKCAESVFMERPNILRKVMNQSARSASLGEALLREDNKILQETLFELSRLNGYAEIWMVVDENQRVIARRNGARDDIIRLGNALSEALSSGESVISSELVTPDLLAREDIELAGRLRSNNLVQFIISPVKAKNRIEGAIVAGILLSTDPWFGNEIINRYGIEAALFVGESPETSLLHTTSSFPRQTWSLGQKLPKGLWENASLGRSYFGLLDIGNTPQMVGLKPVKDSRSRIIASMLINKPAENINTVIIKALIKAVTIVAIVGLIIALIVTYFIKKDITRPLNFLTSAMADFGSGDLDISVDIKTGDEFERLGEGFNSMAGGIRSREKRLKKHYEVAKLLMSTLNLRDLLEKILKVVVDVTGSQMGILYIYEEGRKALVPHVHYGTKSELPAIPEDEGFPGQALKNNEVLTVNPPEIDEDTKMDLGFAQSFPAEIAYIPLTFQNNKLGVLALGSVKVYEFEELELFDYLANQISIALDNAIMHQKIQELSITDPLTGLYNRRHMNSRLEEAWARCERHKEPLSILLSDVDNFKSINDTYGHDKGDEVLKVIGKAFSDNIRAEDLAARYGGEEFVAVLTGVDSREAFAMAERIRKTIKGVDFEWLDRHITLSIGVASIPEIEAESYEGLIQKADQAMYQAKTSGKDKTVIAKKEA